MGKVLVLGSSGMLGSAVLRECMRIGLDATGTSRSGIEVEGTKTLPFSLESDPRKFLRENLLKFDYVINCIGLIPHKFENSYELDLSRAIDANSIFPNILADYSAYADVKLIQIATDCVFSGIEGAYTEDSNPDPRDIYGITKQKGEVTADNVLNLRCSVIGPEKKSAYSLLSWFFSQPESAQVQGYLNHRWNGVTALAFAKVVSGIVKANAFFPGTQHLIPQDAISKYGLLTLLSKHGSRNDLVVIPWETEIGVNRTLATKNSNLNDGLWQIAGYPCPPTIEQMIDELFGILKDEEH
jgi:dTDP-4-dehydrorhamnose reductase